MPKIDYEPFVYTRYNTPVYIPDLGDRYPVDWRDAGHWLICRGPKLYACYHGAYFSTPGEVYADLINRFNFYTEEPIPDTLIQGDPDGAANSWGTDFTIWRNSQIRLAMFEEMGGGPERFNVTTFPGVGCITIKGNINGGIDGLYPTPADWPDRLDLIRDGRILLPDPMAIPPRAMELFRKFGEMCEAKAPKLNAKKRSIHP